MNQTDVYLKRALLLMKAALLFFVPVGCGPAYPVDPEDQEFLHPENLQEESQSYSIEQLGIEFFRVHSTVFQFRGNGYPMPQDWISGYHDFSSYGASYGKYEVTYSRVIHLLDLTSVNPVKQEEVFIVWSDQYQNQKVVNVVAEHHVLDGKNQWIGDFNPYPVWHDLERKKWVIPISRLFQGSNSIYQKTVNESDTQQVTLLITLADASQVRMNLKFRVTGPLPQF